MGGYDPGCVTRDPEGEELHDTIVDFIDDQARRIEFLEKALAQATEGMGANTKHEDGRWETVRRGIYDYPEVEDVPDLVAFLEAKEALDAV